MGLGCLTSVLEHLSISDQASMTVRRTFENESWSNWSSLRGNTCTAHEAAPVARWDVTYVKPRENPILFQTEDFAVAADRHHRVLTPLHLYPQPQFAPHHRRLQGCATGFVGGRPRALQVRAEHVAQIAIPEKAAPESRYLPGVCVSAQQPNQGANAVLVLRNGLRR